jgi:hypothetical protein
VAPVRKHLPLRGAARVDASAQALVQALRDALAA